MPDAPSTERRLSAIRTIELTTYGRRTGRPNRVEIWWFRFDDRFVITGTPGPRDWLANVRANPAVVVHAGGSDHPGHAIEITDEGWKRRFFEQTQNEVHWYREQAGLSRLVADSPMIEIRLGDHT